MGVSRWNQQFRAFAKARGKVVRGDKELLIAAFLEFKGQQLRRQAPYAQGAPLRAKARRMARKHRVAFLGRVLPVDARRRDRLSRPDALLFKPVAHPLRDSLAPNFLADYVPMRKRLRQRGSAEVDLTHFSFAKKPNETLALLGRIANLCTSRADLRMNFRDRDCDDITPYIVLARLRPSLPPVISGGQISRSVRQVVEAVGMRGPLRIGSISTRIPKDEREAGQNAVSAFNIHNRTPPGAFGDEDHLLRPQVKEVVADRFVDTLNGWIGEYDLELTDEAIGSFTRAIGEALDNAERHGDALEGREGEWSIAGFSKLVLSKDEKPMLQCSVGIVSLGATISESLKSAGEIVTKEIDTYVQHHRSILGSPERTDAMRCVMALQDGITRDSAASAAKRGGVGFMELIDVFAELGDNGRQDRPSTFTIISGRTCIRVTSPYCRGERKESWRRELWFNEPNDPSHAPSEKHVMTLDHAFPGVILSACFTIDPEHLRKKLNDDVAND